MTKTAFAKIAAGLDDAIAYAKGDKSKGRVAAPLDVKAIRAATGKSQTDFANSFGFSVDTIQNYEAGRRSPVGPARTLLAMVQTDAKTVERLIAKAGPAPRP